MSRDREQEPFGRGGSESGVFQRCSGRSLSAQDCKSTILAEISYMGQNFFAWCFLTLPGIVLEYRQLGSGHWNLVWGKI